jgi:FtsZ-binding cell division protein ZapB
MTQTSEPTRIDRLEALAETTLLAVRELSNRQNDFQQQQETSQNQMQQLQQRFEDVANQQSANAEQIAANTAGVTELRNIVADFIRSQQR